MLFINLMFLAAVYLGLRYQICLEKDQLETAKEGLIEAVRRCSAIELASSDAKQLTENSSEGEDKFQI